MRTNHMWSRASKPAQLLAILVTVALVIFGITALPTYAAAPRLKLAVMPGETLYLSGVEQCYVVEFACVSTMENCVDSVVTIVLPHMVTPADDSNPDSAFYGVSVTATAGKEVVTPTVKAPAINTDGLVTYNLGTIAAGSSFQTILTSVALRDVASNDSIITPVATLISGENKETFQMAAMVKPESMPLLSKTSPVASPRNADVTYRIMPKYNTSVDGINGKSYVTNVIAIDPLSKYATYMSPSALGNTKTTTTATAESSYDAAIRTVTWSIDDVNSVFMNSVLSVTVHCDDICTGDIVTDTVKLTGGEINNKTNVVITDASSIHHFDSEIRYGNDFNKRAMGRFERGKQGNWLYSYSSNSNVPVVVGYTDYLACDLVSLADSSKDCGKPFMSVKTIDTQTTIPIEVTYWTNKGNTGAQTVYHGKAFDFFSFTAGKYLTVFRCRQTIPADESLILSVAGPVSVGTLTTESSTTYIGTDTNSAA